MKILSVNISEAKGTEKKPVDSITLNEQGIISDAHAGTWHRQITLVSKESVDRFSQQSGRRIKPGGCAENILMKRGNLEQINLLDHLKIDKVLLEVTQIGKKHHIDDKTCGKNIMIKEGIFCRVLNGGVLKAGDKIEVIKKSLNIHIITLSDRASAGEYPDKSGPEIKKLLENHFYRTHFSTICSLTLIPDSKKKLKSVLRYALNEKCDIIFTTGGTGISKKDITPDVIKPMLQKEIPGIMEYIRVKYADKLPSALLSRSIAGIIDNTLVFTLPGSVKAAREYIFEINRILNHALLALKGIEIH